MTKIPKTYLLLGIIILLIIIVSLFDINSSKTANRGQYPTPSENLKEKTNKLEKEEGNVDVIVEYLPEKSDANTLVFNIILDTHNVNLDSFNFEKDVFLGKEGRGSLPIKISQSGSVHHRKAELAFNKTSTPFTIVLSNLSGISKREFKFTDI